MTRILTQLNLLHRICHGLIALDLFEQNDLPGFVYYAKDFMSLTVDEMSPFLMVAQVGEVKNIQATFLALAKSPTFLTETRETLIEIFEIVLSSMNARLRRR